MSNNAIGSYVRKLIVIVLMLWQALYHRITYLFANRMQGKSGASLQAPPRQCRCSSAATSIRRQIPQSTSTCVEDPWMPPPSCPEWLAASIASGSRRCALIGVPCRLRRLSLFSTFTNMLLTNKCPQANHAETDPRHGTPTRAHFHRLINAPALLPRVVGWKCCYIRGNCEGPQFSEPDWGHRSNLMHTLRRTRSTPDSQSKSLELWEFEPSRFLCLRDDFSPWARGGPWISRPRGFLPGASTRWRESWRPEPLGGTDPWALFSFAQECRSLVLLYTNYPVMYCMISSSLTQVSWNLQSQCLMVILGVVADLTWCSPMFKPSCWPMFKPLPWDPFGSPWSLSLPPGSVHLIYIYIHIYTHIHMYST